MQKGQGTLIAMVVMGLVAYGGQVKTAGDPEAGKAVYKSKCMICHGVDGEGKTGYAKAMNLEPARLGSDAVQKKTDAEIKKIITEGSGKMKPIKDISDADIANVIVYVHQSFGKK